MCKFPFAHRNALPDRMLMVYKSLLDNDAPSIRCVMEAIDECGAGGCTLFHCRAGKDRTGVIAMLLLGLAGVSDEDIVADYAATQQYLGWGCASSVGPCRRCCAAAPRG